MGFFGFHPQMRNNFQLFEPIFEQNWNSLELLTSSIKKMNIHFAVYFISDSVSSVPASISQQSWFSEFQQGYKWNLVIKNCSNCFDEWIKTSSWSHTSPKSSKTMLTQTLRLNESLHRCFYFESSGSSNPKIPNSRARCRHAVIVFSAKRQSA